jgi:hypothetical protein
MAGPDEKDGEEVHGHDQQHLRHHRIPQAQGRGHGGVEPRARRVGNHAAVEKLPGQREHPLMHDQLRDDQHRQRQQEPGVRFDVLQEGNTDRAAPEVPAQGREDQQREPREERDGDDPAAQELQRIAAQMGALEHLEQRSAQDHREVVRVACLAFRRGAKAGGEMTLES